MPTRRFSCIGFLAWTVILTSVPSATGLLAAASETAQVDVATEEGAGGVPDGLTMRARIASIKPAEPVALQWRHGGEGMGGEVVRVVLAPKLDVGVTPADPKFLDELTGILEYARRPTARAARTTTRRRGVRSGAAWRPLSGRGSSSRWRRCWRCRRRKCTA